MALSSRSKLLVVGGYGSVGKHVCALLAETFPGRVVVAGRRYTEAVKLAEEVGRGATARFVDVTSADVEALSQVQVAVVCVEQTDVQFAHLCLSNGVAYVDITASFQFLTKVTELETVAKENGTFALLSAGIAPGLSNMLAAYLRKKVKKTLNLDILVELDAFDSYGRHAVEWMLDNIDKDFITGENTVVRSFRERKAFVFPGEESARYGYRINFPDQFILPTTLQISEVSSYLRFSSSCVTNIIALLSRCGMTKLLKYGLLRKVVVKLLLNLSWGSGSCGVAVYAEDERGKLSSVSIRGKREAYMTALCVGEMVRQVVDNSPSGGIYHSEQVIEFQQLLQALRDGMKDALEVWL